MYYRRNRKNSSPGKQVSKEAPSREDNDQRGREAASKKKNSHPAADETRSEMFKRLSQPKAVRVRKCRHGNNRNFHFGKNYKETAEKLVTKSNDSSLAESSGSNSVKLLNINSSPSLLQRTPVLESRPEASPFSNQMTSPRKLTASQSPVLCSPHRQPSSSLYQSPSSAKLRNLAMTKTPQSSPYRNRASSETSAKVGITLPINRSDGTLSHTGAKSESYSTSTTMATRLRDLKKQESEAFELFDKLRCRNKNSDNLKSNVVNTLGLSINSRNTPDSCIGEFFRNSEDKQKDEIEREISRNLVQSEDCCHSNVIKSGLCSVGGSQAMTNLFSTEEECEEDLSFEELGIVPNVRRLEFKPMICLPLNEDRGKDGSRSDSTLARLQADGLENVHTKEKNVRSMTDIYCRSKQAKHLSINTSTAIESSDVTYDGHNVTNNGRVSDLVSQIEDLSVQESPVRSPQKTMVTFENACSVGLPNADVTEEMVASSPRV